MKQKIIIWVVVVAAALVLLPGVALAQVASTSPGLCTKLSIQAAINDAVAAGSTDVYIEEGTHTESLVIPATITLHATDLGNDCNGAATAGTQPVILTPALGGDRVMVITGGDTTLRNIRVRDGGAPGGGAGGNILFASAGVLRLEESYVGNGEADRGGGIALTGCGSLEVASGSRVLANRAIFDGGGVAALASGCSSTPRITVSADAAIGTGAGNRAGEEGGDVYLEGAELYVEGGGQVRGGRAVLGGGCVAAFDGSVVDLSGTALVTSCSATDPAALGGGVLLEESSLFVRDTAQITSGQTHGSGGLVALTNFSSLTAENDAALATGYAEVNGGLVYAEAGSAASFTGSAQLSGGTATLGGGIYAAGETTSVSLSDDAHVHGCIADLDGGGIYLADAVRT